MSDSITWVGMDAHKSSIQVAMLPTGAKKPRECTVSYDPRAIRRFARKLVAESSGEVRCCYEAGPLGYDLMRQLEAAAPLVCEVVAPALIPIRPGQRIKTDRRDARKLVGLYRAGELTMVHPPSVDDESIRDLVRAREDARQDLTRCRHRLSKWLLRRGVPYTGGRAWTQRHRQWLHTLSWERESDRAVAEEYVIAIEACEDRRKRLDETLETISQAEPYTEPVRWLRCFHGVDTVTAMGFLAELYDFRRFRTPRRLFAYLGLVPQEYSSGGRTLRGPITKTGNRHVRRLLIEAAFHYRHGPKAGLALRKRRQGAPPWAIARGNKAHRRLYKRYWQLLARGKAHNKAIAAVARELTGFLWAMLQEGEEKQLVK